MNDEISIGDLVELIAELNGTKIEITQDEQRVRPGKSEVERLYCNNTKIIENTDWRPQYSLRSGLAETIEWIRSNMQYFKPDIYNI